MILGFLECHTPKACIGIEDKKGGVKWSGGGGGGGGGGN